MTLSTEELEKALTDKLMLNFGKLPEDASDGDMMRASAMVLRDIMAIREVQTRRDTRREQKKQVHYLSLEFLMGRSLMKNAYNLEVLPQLREAMDHLGFKAADVFEVEPDAALGNGGLGRLAACYLDSMTTLEIPATGYSICYELGLFKQRIVEGQQVELPDNWKNFGSVWLMPKPEESQEVFFGGHLREFWEDDHLHIVQEDATKVIAVPCDMVIAGYDTDHVNTLRLWDAHSVKPVDLDLFSRGEFLKAAEEETMAKTIAKILYPDDNSREGKSLRLKQQYFFVSATVQSIAQKHLETYGTLRNFHEKNVIQINDTHPALVIPELMRIFMDEAGMDWDEAWEITCQSVAYTNHTVLAEALERWPQDLVQTVLPRIWQILAEISRRWQIRVGEHFYNHEAEQSMAILWGDEVRMANLCIAGGMAVNGVSALHSDILKKDVFKYAYQMEPWKFHNVTNGVDHRRWLSEINPGLDALIKELTGGDDYLTHPEALIRLDAYADDAEVQRRMGAIKRANKVEFSNRLKRRHGITINPDAIFDVQVKRLHEYKRQLLNAFHILVMYQKLQDDPNYITVPHTYLFGAKAAPGYYIAKQIIRFINSLADQIAHDPICKDKLQVVFLENYRVSMAERLMPASEVSQQISTAGKEASGTGNMKFMMNGALTIGTLDGANVEMHNVLGDENMFLFGLHADEVERVKREGYIPQRLYSQNPVLRRALDALRTGFRDGNSYNELYQSLLFGSKGSPADTYMLLADFDDYCRASERVAETYKDQSVWNRMSIHNVARSGIFAADRSIAEYADNIWHVPHKHI